MLRSASVRRCTLLAIALLVLGGCRDGPTAPRPAADPRQPAASRVVDMAIAFGTTCALTEAGSLFCWGENRFGEFGNGTTTHSPVPVPAAAGLRLTRVFGSVGTPQICGIGAEGEAYCWGYNLNGELGDGTTTTRSLPSAVAGGRHFTALASSYHTCGIDADGVALCWGSSLGGQLGDGSSTCCEPALEPRPVATSLRYSAITNGMQFSCAIATAGDAYCWGWGVGLGSGSGDRSVSTPTAVSGGHRYARVSASLEHACALDTGGAAYCWGKGGNTWPGDFRPEPVAVPTSLRFREIVSGAAWGACAITTTGEAWCWAGDLRPRLVPGNHRWAGIVASVAMGAYYCGFTPGGSASCWNLRVQSSTADILLPTVPEPIPALPTATTLR
jgi:alpha-tubulin suppressor-like RCC1 family protein